MGLSRTHPHARATPAAPKRRRSGSGSPSASRQVARLIDSPSKEVSTEQSVMTGAGMRARQLIGSAGFPPDALKVIGDAFEDAWAELASHVSSDPTVVDAARLSLAEIVVGIARAGPIDYDRIKTAAVDVFCTVHRIGI